MTTREDAINALLAVLAPAGSGYKSIGRRNAAPENFTPETTPALMLLCHSDEYMRPSPSVPPKRKMVVLAIIYVDSGTDANAVPDTTINGLLDAIDAALVPDNQALGRCTLGGRVYSAMIDGNVERAPGDVTGKSLAIVPIKIEIP